MTYEFPVRLKSTAPIPPAKARLAVESVRQLVVSSSRETLTIDEAAAEILSRIVGTTLRPSQVQALLPAIHEQLTAAPPQPQPNTGPLSQTDAMSALLGIAHFLLDRGGDWLLASIPIANQSSPDLYAIPPSGKKPWYVELKGSAPLSSEVEDGDKLDVCARMCDQLRTARAQVAHTPDIGDGPKIKVSAGMPVLHPSDAGGRAVSAFLLPDGYLAGRTKILPVDGKSCPKHKRCAEECVAAPQMPFRTSLVGLLWTEDSGDAQGGGEGAEQWRNCLAAMEALNIALWAGTTRAGDDALRELADRSGELPISMAIGMLDRGLIASRFATSSRARVQAVEALIRRGETNSTLNDRLFRETDLGIEPPREIGFESFAGGDIAPDTRYEISFRGAGYEAHGSVVGESLRLAPRVGLMDRLFTGDVDALETASHALRQNILPRLYGDTEAKIPLVDVGVAAGERRYVVGRASESSVILPTLRVPPKLRRDYRNAVSAARRGDHAAWHRFVDTWAASAGSSIEWRLLDRWMHFIDMAPFPSRWWPWLPDSVSWASRDGRISASL